MIELQRWHLSEPWAGFTLDFNQVLWLKCQTSHTPYVDAVSTSQAGWVQYSLLFPKTFVHLACSYDPTVCFVLGSAGN